MTTQEAIGTIRSHHAVEGVTQVERAENATGENHYWIMLKDGHNFGDGTHNWLVSEGKLKKIATLIAI